MRQIRKCWLFSRRSNILLLKQIYYGRVVEKLIFHLFLFY
ncbi:hypothetical protein LEP1GSC188_1264 [Leptospira weilii serovar Topaz str. LT2116]|uniref:Uncharacterized protein n=1 Tax=Leptospira weilii serovar Topaz str. LT2116 TaxID=1088540 RepID=M3GCL4_9LEPT|nr:hypothetical protein LEP1GSC188_1264 [Leptospira weilii serovar Topaz str. LT2116]